MASRMFLPLTISQENEELGGKVLSYYKILEIFYTLLLLLIFFLRLKIKCDPESVFL